MNRTGSTVLALGLSLAVFLVDQGSKRLVEGSMRIGESIPTVPGVLSLTYTKNDGGAFGILGGQSAVLLLGSAVAVAFVLWMLLKGPPARTTAAGCGLILGGAAGNLIDRVVAGRVTDLFDLEFWPLKEWPVFNVADIAIVLGVTILLLAALRPEANADRPPAVGENPKADGRKINR